MKFSKNVLIIISIFFFPFFQAAKADVGLEVKAGTLGVGVGVIVGVTSHLNLKLGTQSYEINQDFTEDGLNYTAEFKPDNQYLTLDLMPFENGNFRFTVGGMQNDNQIIASAVVAAPANIGTTQINAGSVKAVVSFDSSATYYGIGWGNAFRNNKTFGFTFDLGIMNQGSPTATLTVVDPSNTVTPADINREEADIETELEDFKQYPVIAIGLTYRF